MKLLHIIKSEADHNTTTLMNALSEGKETTTVALYEESPDYETLIDLIFASDQVVSWW